MKSEITISETFLSRKPERSSSLAGLASIVAIFVPSIIFWDNKWDLAQWLPASGETVIHQHQYWRLLTGILVHSDFKHFLSNAVPLAFFGSLLYGYFGFTIFPLLMLALGCLIHLISIMTYPPDATLVGASGVVYCMAGFWLTLFVLIERRYSIANRLMRSIGFFLIVFVPSAFDPSVSYRAHAIGFFAGILSAILYFVKNKKPIRQAELYELEEADA
jgi:rhomboid protease GluP